MELLNKKVEHIKFGIGFISEAKKDKIEVQFLDGIGTKLFLYPEAFQRFLKAVSPAVQDYAMEEYRGKQKELELERECMEKEREAAELEEKKAKLKPSRKKSTGTKIKK